MAKEQDQPKSNEGQSIKRESPDIEKSGIPDFDKTPPPPPPSEISPDATVLPDFGHPTEPPPPPPTEEG